MSGQELPEASFKRTRSDADFSQRESQRERKRAKTEKPDEKTKVGSAEVKKEKGVNDEQELMQYLNEWPCGHNIRVRDGSARDEENAGVLTWVTIENDGSDTNLKLLAQLKQIISIQLPKMPKSYIMRLVFDLQHKSLIGIKSGKVIGGITFRPFVRDGFVSFIEVVFCVITKHEQRGGYGSRLMNRLKNWCQKNDNLNLLTYADDTAIGYFQRQGFSADIEMDVKDWDIGFLKYYDSATLMHCLVDTRIDYLEINQQNRLQRATFCKKMRQLSYQHIQYDGIKKVAERGPPLIDHTKVVGLIEAGWNPAQLEKLLEKDSQEQIYRENKALLDQIKNASTLSHPFSSPVVELYPNLADNYLQTISDPIDLRTITEKLERRVYICPEMMLADLHRMIENCKTFLKAIYIINKQKAPEKDDLYLQAENINTRFLEKRRSELGIQQPVVSNNEGM
jgi:histone acetyltransferase